MTSKPLTFCDPIHGLISFYNEEADLVRSIIERPEFQRLRYIKQLGLTDLLFPCATHTRFSHSLGVCFVAKRIYERLSGEAAGHLSREKALLLQAALLHDIGHGPFSHAFEAFTSRIDKTIKHDAHWLDAFLQAFKVDAGVKAIIQRQDLKRAYLSDIVSSQLDADRMDYLLRDSHFCGVTYGEFEIDWLINHLQLSDIVDNDQKQTRLCVHYKGMSALEHFIMARRLMNRYVYHHLHTLGADHLLVEFLSALATALVNLESKQGSLQQSLQTIAKLHLGQLLIALKQDPQDGEAFVQQHFTAYRDLVDLDIIQAFSTLARIDSNHDVCRLAQRLFHRHIPRALLLNPTSFEQAQAIVHDYLAKESSLQDWQLCIQRINFSAYHKDRQDQIYVIDPMQVAGVHNKSNVLALLSDKVEDTCYLLVDSAIKHDVDDLFQQLQAANCIYQQTAQLAQI